MKALNFLVVMLGLFLTISPVNAAEFAYYINGRVLLSESAGNGSSISVGYGGFGLTGSVEYKHYETDSFLAGYVGFRSGVSVELGVSEHGPSLRGGFEIPVVQHLNFAGSSSLYFTAAYEKYFNEDAFSGLQTGLQLIIYD